MKGNSYLGTSQVKVGVTGPREVIPDVTPAKEARGRDINSLASQLRQAWTDNKSPEGSSDPRGIGAPQK